MVVYLQVVVFQQAGNRPNQVDWKVAVLPETATMRTLKPKLRLKTEKSWLLLKEPKMVAQLRHKSKEHIAELGPFQHLLKHLIKIDPPKLK